MVVLICKKKKVANSEQNRSIAKLPSDSLIDFDCFNCLGLFLISKETIGTEYLNTQPVNLSETIVFADMSMAIIPKAAFEKLSGCITLVLINTKTIQINADAWLGLNNLESLSIEEGSMITLEADMFNHLKSLTRLKVTTRRIENFSVGSAPIKSAAFRGLLSLNSLWLTLPNLNELTFQTMDYEVWIDIVGTLTGLILPENDFRELYDHMLIQFPKLKKLSFRSNRIRTVSSKALNGLELLREIDLSQNRINE